MSSIGDLVANLTVNSTGFKNGLAQSSSSLKSFGSSISSMVAPIAGTLAGMWGTKASIEAFKTDLQAQQKLGAVLAATGNAANLTGKEIAAYASKLQGVTNFGDEVTISAAAMLAAFTNIKGDLFKDVLASAQDLSTVMGGDLASNVKLLGKAFDNPAEGMSKLAKSGVTFTEAQEKQIKAMQESGDLAGAQGVMLDALQGKFGGAAQAMADPWTQFMNALGDIGEVIGSVLMPSLSVLSTSLTGMTSIVTGATDWFKSMGIEAAVVFSHIGELTTLGVTQWELFFVQIEAAAAHFFTEAFPTYLTWFYDNWQNIFFTAIDYSLTLFINLGENIRMMWQQVLNFFAGEPVEFNWTPLLEGAASAISALPDIPERVAGDFEKSLITQIDNMSAKIGVSMDEQRAELEKKFSPLDNAKLAPIIAPEEDAATAAGTKGMKAVGSLKASFMGSSEAASILLRGTGGGQSVEKKLDTQIALQKEQLAATKANKPVLAAANI